MAAAAATHGLRSVDLHSVVDRLTSTQRSVRRAAFLALALASDQIKVSAHV